MIGVKKFRIKALCLRASVLGNCGVFYDYYDNRSSL